MNKQKKIGFLVVDESHHIGQAREGNRHAYLELKNALEELHNPLVLAVTATAGDSEACIICNTLNIQDLVIDKSCRNNLHIDDKRDIKYKDNYVASIVAEGEKCIIYVNSRSQTISLTRELRKKLPDLAPKISFYNAGLPRSVRHEVERKFREGELLTIVSTSAFGEGIDIPDVKHVMLYHMPFNDIEFNQMSGRSGRNGEDAYVHLLFSLKDAHINEMILSSSAPKREHMISVYKALLSYAQLAKTDDDTSFSVTNAAIAENARLIDRRCKLDESAVSTCISVFRELQFLNTSGRGVARRITMVQSPEKMNLQDSIRYKEGIEEIDHFKNFKLWALSSDAKVLLSRFNSPIIPANPDNILP